MGLPWRVIRRGFFGLRTCSNRAKHLALNSENGDFFHGGINLVKIIDHGQINSQSLAGAESSPKAYPHALFELVHGFPRCG